MQMQQTHASTPISYQNKTQRTKHTNISGQNQSHTAAATLDKQITFRLSTSAVGKKKCIDTLMAKIVKKKKRKRKKRTTSLRSSCFITVQCDWGLSAISDTNTMYTRVWLQSWAMSTEPERLNGAQLGTLHVERDAFGEEALEWETEKDAQTGRQSHYCRQRDTHTHTCKTQCTTGSKNI